MLAANIPSKFVAAFANAAGAGYSRSIPLTQGSPGNGAASLNTGFPPETFTPPGSGGYAPDGRDVNGVLFPTTGWAQWFSAGGAVPWDSAFSSAVGGYPLGAIVASATTFGLQWISMIDNNMAIPDMSGPDWMVWPYNLYANDSSGSANTITAIFALPALFVIPGLSVRVGIANTNTGATTMNTKEVILPNGLALTGGELQSGGIYTFVYDGTHYQLQGVGPFSATFTSSPIGFEPAGGTLTIPHGLGGVPFGYQPYLHCVINDTGWSAGDELKYESNSNTSSNQGWQLSADASNIYVLFGSNSSIDVLTYGTGSSATITNANWAIVVRAWR